MRKVPGRELRPLETPQLHASVHTPTVPGLAGFTGLGRMPGLGSGCRPPSLAAVLRGGPLTHDPQDRESCKGFPRASRARAVGVTADTTPLCKVKACPIGQMGRHLGLGEHLPQVGVAQTGAAVAEPEGGRVSWEGVQEPGGGLPGSSAARVRLCAVSSSATRPAQRGHSGSQLRVPRPLTPAMGGFEIWRGEAVGPCFGGNPLSA